LQLAELPLDPVQVQVDLPLVVTAEAHPEDDVVDLRGGDRRAPFTVEGRLDTVEEGVHLVDLVPATQRPAPEPLTVSRHLIRPPVPRVGHCVTSAAASCPHAPSISRPRVSRTVVARPASRSRRTNSCSTGLGLAYQRLPGVGLSGISLTCARRP